MMDRREELKSLLDIYKTLRQDESEYNIYRMSEFLEALIEKTEKQIEELKDE